MTSAAHDKVVRFAADLLASASVEGARERRSARQQLDHWARVGRAVSDRESASRRRVEAALSAELPMAALTDAERVVVHAEVDARIQESLRTVDYGAVLAAEGVTTVALDDLGNLVEHRPDGSTSTIYPVA